MKHEGIRFGRVRCIYSLRLLIRRMAFTEESELKFNLSSISGLRHRTLKVSIHGKLASLLLFQYVIIVDNLVRGLHSTSR